MPEKTKYFRLFLPHVLYWFSHNRSVFKMRLLSLQSRISSHCIRSFYLYDNIYVSGYIALYKYSYRTFYLYFIIFGELCHHYVPFSHLPSFRRIEEGSSPGIQEIMGICDGFLADGIVYTPPRSSQGAPGRPKLSGNRPQWRLPDAICLFSCISIWTNYRAIRRHTFTRFTVHVNLDDGSRMLLDDAACCHPQQSPHFLPNSLASVGAVGSVHTSI